MCFSPFLICMVNPTNFGIAIKLPTNPYDQLFVYISSWARTSLLQTLWKYQPWIKVSISLSDPSKSLRHKEHFIFLKAATLIARFEGPTWDRPQVGRVLATWTFLYENGHQGDSHRICCRASCCNPTIFKSLYIFVHFITTRANLSLNLIGQTFVTFNTLVKSSSNSICVNQNCTSELLLKAIN